MNETTVIENSKPAEKFLVPTRYFIFPAMIGGPLAGVYLMGKNFKSLGHKKASRYGWLFGIALAIISIVIYHFLRIGSQVTPVFAQIAENFFLNLIFTAIIYYSAKKFQGKAIKQGLQNGYKQYPVWKAIIIPIIVGIIGNIVLGGLCGAVISIIA